MSNDSGEAPTRVMEEDEHRLDWRVHGSYSDWKLIVLREEDNGDKSKGTVYDLHKVALAFGRRRCTYFTALFEFKEHAGPDCTTSTIQLSNSLAAAVPYLLDFVYDLPSFKIQKDMATPLHSLADMMGNQPLKMVVEEFMEEHLEKEHLDELSHPIFYKQAKALLNQDVLDLLVRWYVNFAYEEDLMYPNLAKQIFQLSDVDFWIHVLEEMWKQKSKHPRGEDYWYYTEVLIYYACLYLPAMSSNQFIILTSEKYLGPCLGALELLRAEQKFAEIEPKGQQQLSSLQRRCAVSLEENWYDCEEEYQQEIVEYVQEHPFLKTAAEFARFRVGEPPS
jgi:hypothetical protein